MKDMESPNVSVVVPVYNVEEYLPECVESILRQSFSNFELILVDDGSPDNCGSICDSYAEKDSRVRVIHKKNGGLSDARNRGIEQAKGEFITFVDSDDIIYKDYLKYLYEAAQKYDADIVQGAITTHLDKLGSLSKDSHQQEYDIRLFSGEEAIRDYLTYRTHCSNSTFKLIRTTLFEGVRFPVGKYSEDEYTTYRLVLKSRKDVCLPMYIYYYRLREGSIVRSYSSRRFDVCDELPSLMEKDVVAAGYNCKPEIDYKNMRIQLKIYNDFVQGGQFQEFKVKLCELQDRIKKIKVDKSIWDRKYIFIRLAISYCPRLYRTIVYKYRSEHS